MLELKDFKKKTNKSDTLSAQVKPCHPIGEATVIDIGNKAKECPYLSV